MNKDTSSRNVRVRRSGEEVRSRLVAAGRDVFAERGYAGASTKEIANRAEVAEVLLFRHFGNKAGLFDEAVLEPFERFVDEYAGQWSRRSLSGASFDELARDYIDLLFGFVDENRDLLTVLLATRAHHPTTAARLDRLFSRLESFVRQGTAEHGKPSLDPALTVRLTFGLVLSAVIHGEILFPAGSPSRARMVDELTRYMLHGIS